MTIAPTSPTASPTAASSAGLPAGDPAAAGDFLAAILQALAPAVTAPAPDAATAADLAADTVTGTLTGTLAGTLAGVATAPPVDLESEQESEPQAPDPVQVGLVPPGLAGQLAAAPVAPVAAPGPAIVAAGAAVAPTSPTRDIRMSGDEISARSDATTTPGDASATSEAPATTTPGPAVPASPAAAADSSAVQPAPPASPVPTAGPAASTATPQTDTAAPAQHVTRQVFPEVTSLVTRGNGTHRITLTLNPEALGEVRVVMTVRDGSVHVRLAAGQEAQQALRDGSPELTRLLEASGASESRVVVRDLPAAPTTPAAQATAGGATPDLGTGGQRPQDQHAGTRADQPATDGTHDGTPHRRGATGADRPQSNEPVTRTRTAGVDVTM